MPLTPIDVQQKTFGTALRGYDLDEVDDFLDDIVTSLKDYEQRLRDAQERIATLEMEMTDRGDAEG
ncbi:MAG: DivIVA domain-containing protein, partial [Acidimicrobiia bacterium]